jgi:propanol-preferring alcohol dehydrogenase
VGVIEELGDGAEDWGFGDRIGVPWLYRACGTCDHCARGEENLCDQAQFTGFHVDGGYAEFMVADARYVLPLPDRLSDEEVAPLLCAGIIGYRSLHKSDLQPGERLGLVGFGASAHLAIQVAIYWGCEVYVFTRSESHRQLAMDLGAAWVGGSEDRAPLPLDRAILFAPVGDLVPVMLEKIRPGGTLAINAIHLSPIPEMEYRVIYGERTLRSVANATYRDGVEFLRLATEIPVKVSMRKYALEEANQALNDLKNSRIDGAGVLLP